MKKVVITQRTADGLLTRCAELEELAARFNAVGSRGRAQELIEIARTLRKMGTDLKAELEHRGRTKLKQIREPSKEFNGA